MSMRTPWVFRAPTGSTGKPRAPPSAVDFVRDLTRASACARRVVPQESAVPRGPLGDSQAERVTPAICSIRNLNKDQAMALLARIALSTRQLRAMRGVLALTAAATVALSALGLLSMTDPARAAGVSCNTHKGRTAGWITCTGSGTVRLVIDCR